MRNTLTRTFHLLSSQRQLIKRGVSTDPVDRHCAVLLHPSSLLLLCISITTVRYKVMGFYNINVRHVILTI
jgi:hypothetical protein